MVLLILFKICIHFCFTFLQIFPGLILSDIKPAKRMKFKTVCYLLVQLMHCRKMFKAEIPFSNVMTCEDDDKVSNISECFYSVFFLLMCLMAVSYEIPVWQGNALSRKCYFPLFILTPFESHCLLLALVKQSLSMPIVLIKKLLFIFALITLPSWHEVDEALLLVS